MTEVLWPLDLIPSSQTWSIIGNAATFTSPLSGATRTYGRPGARLGCTMTFPPMKGQDRARLLAFINTLLDRSNRVWVPDFSTTRRGSFPAPELLTNNDFASGTNGWSSDGSSALSVADRVMRSVRVNGAGTSVALHPSATSSVLSQQTAAYCARFFVANYSGDRASGFRIDWGSTAGGNEYGNGTPSTGAGMKSEAFVPWTTALAPRLADGTATGLLAGQYINIGYSSLARCFQVDGGGNLLTHSDQFDNAAWVTNGLTVTANDTVAPDGTTTADSIAENGATSEHYIEQGAITVTSAAQDIAFAVAINGATRSWYTVGLVENTGSSVAYVYFDVSNGVVGSASNGANWANVRGFISDIGNGWYVCCIVARKTNSATTIRGRINSATANGAALVFSGNSSTVGRL